MAASQGQAGLPVLSVLLASQLNIVCAFDVANTLASTASKLDIKIHRRVLFRRRRCRWIAVFAGPGEHVAAGRKSNSSKYRLMRRLLRMSWKHCPKTAAGSPQAGRKTFS
jgi:hypothetical protein